MDNKILICERCGKSLHMHKDDDINKGWLCDDEHYYASSAARPLLCIDGFSCYFQGPLTKYGSYYSRFERQ